jgi:AraC-like DNA-binding protein
MGHEAANGSVPSADALRVQARGAAVRSLYERGLTWVLLDPIPDLACGADIAMRQLPTFGLQSGTVWGNRHEYTCKDVESGNDDLSIHINLSGRSIVSVCGREITLRDGDAVLLSYTESRTVTRPGHVYHRIARLPRASLAPLVRNIDDYVSRPIRRDTGALNLLASYVGALVDDPMIAIPEMRRLVLTQLCDLAAVTLNATRDAARLRAIKSDIEANLVHGDLSPAAVARRQGISDSYIRKLFEGEGTSFSEFVLLRRLVRAHRMLTDRRLATQNIAWIAFEAGFGDVSYFNRTFKRFYGARPSEIRASIDR